MKLRNKLIPIFSVAATAVTVAPLATSCGNIVLEEMELTDVLHGYLPEMEKAVVEGTITESQAKDLYINHIKNNPNIFAQDLYWWEGLAVKYRLYNAAVGSGRSSFLDDLEELYGLFPTTEEEADSFDVIPSVAKFGVSDIKFSDVELVNPNTLEKEKINLISLKFNYEYQFEINADVANNTTRYSAQRNTTVSLTSEYKNIPFTVLWDTQYACWRVMPTGWFTVYGTSNTDTTWIPERLHDWSFNFDYKSITTDVIKNYEGGVDTYTYDDSKGGLIDSVAKLKNWLPDDRDDLEALVRTIVFNFGSYHMYDVLGPQWSYGNLGYLGKDRRATIQKTATENVYQITMPEAITRSWTFAEYHSDTRPKSRKDWELTNVYKPDTQKTNTFELFDTTTNKQVGYVQFDKEVDVPRGPSRVVQTQFNVDIYANVTVTDPEAQAKISAQGEAILLDPDSYNFTLPNQTTFEFSVYFGEDESGKDVYKTETFQINTDVKCMWDIKTKANKKA